ncbi:MAG TPA: TVP38/TMEM64 family protein, partial [Nitrospiria bacterium]|nr:TVP38/TMEM64 family protein [Nitrospiria bacterium]
MKFLEDRSNVLKFLILIFLLVLAFGFIHLTDLGRYLIPGRIREMILSFGPWAPAIYLLLFSIGPVFMWPEAVLAMAAGLAFGPFWGTVLTILGATMGGTLAFFVARYLGRDFVKRFFRSRLKMLDDKSAEHGFKIIFSLRLIPVVPFNALDYAAGLSKIRFGDYVLGTFLGIMPGAFAYVNLGSNLENIYSWKFVLAVTFLGSLVWVQVFYQRWKRGRPIGKLVVLIFFILAVILFFYFDLERYLTLAELKEHREALLVYTAAHYGPAV